MHCTHTHAHAQCTRAQYLDFIGSSITFVAMGEMMGVIDKKGNMPRSNMAFMWVRQRPQRGARGPEAHERQGGERGVWERGPQVPAPTWPSSGCCGAPSRRSGAGDDGRHRCGAQAMIDKEGGMPRASMAVCALFV